MLFGKGKPCTWYMTIFNRVGVSFRAIHLIHLTLITTFYFIHTEIYTVKYYHSCSIGRAEYFQSVVLSQSLNLKVKKSLCVWNKNIIPWKVIGRFFSLATMHQKNSLVHCAHKFIFLVHRNSWIKIVCVIVAMEIILFLIT